MAQRRTQMLDTVRSAEPRLQPNAEPLPRTCGRYQLFERIGRGGTADIFLARATTELGGARLVVVKQILRELSDDPVFSAMLAAEARLAALLSHANLVQVFDLGREAGRLYIAMEYVEGFDLNQLLRRLSQTHTPLPPEFAFFIVAEVLRGLDCAHRAKNAAGEPMRLVHRDVSPSNVLVSFEGEVKLCDFGIARAQTGAMHDSGPSVQAIRASVAGKGAYMSPEQARGGEVDARSDVYAAGILLWELCAGRRMWRGSDDDVLALARAGAVPPLPDRSHAKPSRLHAVVDKALASDTRDRFQSASDFLCALEDYVEQGRLPASQIRFGEFLRTHFAAEIVQVRNAHELAAQALALGPLCVLTPVALA